jgi:hypothetical protein
LEPAQAVSRIASPRFALAEAVRAMDAAFRRGFGLFRITGCRTGRSRRRPAGQPGAFPRVWGAAAGLPIPRKSAASPACTRPGVFSLWAACQGSGRSATRSRARYNSHWARVTRVVQRSHRSGSCSRGWVQCRRCFRNSIAGSIAHRWSSQPQICATDAAFPPGRPPTTAPAGVPAPGGSRSARHRRRSRRLRGHASRSTAAAAPAPSARRLLRCFRPARPRWWGS